MKILHVTTTKNGGAGIACNRLHTAFLKYEINSEILTADSFRQQRNRFLQKCMGKIDYWLLKRFHHDTNPILHSTGLSGSGLVQQLNASDADIIHLHWINQNFLSIHDISGIHKPLVWTLHDSWPFCGAEHHPNILEHDQRYMEGYSNRNYPATSSGIDTDKWIWRWKKFCWKKLKINFVAPSTWEAISLKQSMLCGKYPCKIIPNCLDTELFKPLSKKALREKLQLPHDKKIVLFGAANLNDPIKGMPYFHAAVKELTDRRNDLHLLTFGSISGKEKKWGTDITHAGVIADPVKMAELYNIADVFVCPSVIENLPNTVMEAISCGVPVTAFHVGGLPDLIRHKEYGYLATPYDIHDLAAGIEWSLNASEEAGRKARNHALQSFTEHTVISAHINLYQLILKNVAPS